MNQEVPNKNRGRLTLIIILLVFALPILVSWLMVSGKVGWQPQSYANHGLLLQPPVNITEYTNQVDGPERLNVTYGNWLLGVFIPGECDQTCQDKMHEIRQVHLSLGRDVNRLTRVLLMGKPLDQQSASLQSLMQDYQEMSQFVNNDPAFLASLFQAAQSAVTDSLIHFVIDSQGNIILLYSLQHEGKGLQKDLARLLRASRTE